MLYTETDMHGAQKNEAPPEKPVIELLIATERRLFIVSSSVDVQPVQTGGHQYLDQNVNLEIVDSIPLEEVESIQMGQPGNWGDDLSYSRREKSDFLQRCFGSLTNLLNKEKNDNADSGQDVENEGNLLGKYIHDEGFDGFLKIKTKSLHGNHPVRSYYFTIIKGTFRSLKKPAGQIDEDALKAQDDTQTKDLERVYRELDSLAIRRRKKFKRDHRFQLFQEKLQAVWDSFAFNICVLLLISSNFIFTVLQLENKDPARQSFFEAVDLSYTVIFSAGYPPNTRTPPGRFQPHVLSIARPCQLNPGSFRSQFLISRDICARNVPQCDLRLYSFRHHPACAAHRRDRTCPEFPRARTLAFPSR
jgi:hypothetical protein